MTHVLSQVLQLLANLNCHPARRLALVASLLRSIYFAYPSRWDWGCRNRIPLKSLHIQEIKVEEEGEDGEK